MHSLKIIAWRSLTLTSILLFLVFTQTSIEFTQAAEKDTVVPDWQKRGLIAAINDPLSDMKEALSEDKLPIFSQLGSQGNVLVPKLIVLLTVTDFYIRRATVQVLSQLEGANAYIPEIKSLLNDPQVYIRLTAVEALVQLEGAQAYISEIITLLTDPDSRVRSDAWEAFGQQEHAQIYASEISALLSDPESYVRFAAVKTLGQLERVDPYVSKITPLLSDTESHVRSAALEALGKIEEAEEYISEIIPLLSDPESYVRSAAVKTLGQLEGADAYVSEITKLLIDPDRDIRSATLKTLSQLVAEEAYISEIIALLTDPDPHTRSAAVSALGQLKGARAYAAEITKLLKDPDPDVRSAALEALGKIEGAEEYISEIIPLLSDTESHIRSAALEALGKIEEAEEYISEIIPLLSDPESYVRSAAVKTLGQLEGAQAYISEIITLLTDPDSRVRSDAWEAFGQQEHAQIYASEISALLSDPESYVRFAAVKTLGQLERVDPYVSKITPLLSDPESYVRSAAVKTLGQLEGADAYVSEITKLLIDPKWSVRLAAMKALVQLKGADTYASDIKALLKVSDSRIRLETMRTLSQLEGVEAYASEIASLLTDSDLGVRLNVVSILDRLGWEQVPISELLPLLNNPGSGARNSVFQVLTNLGPIDSLETLKILALQYDNNFLRGELRFHANFLSGGDQKKDIQTLLAWLAKPVDAKKPIDDTDYNREQAIDTLNVFERTWDDTKDLVRVRRDLAEQIILLVSDYKKWGANESDIPLLKELAEKISDDTNTEHFTSRLNDVIEALQPSKWWEIVVDKIKQKWYWGLIHPAFWLALIFLYPKYRPVQTLFFWNPWVRKLLGLGYIGLVLRWVPYLRNKLFTPFHEGLIADAYLDRFSNQTYFKRTKVSRDDNVQLITKAIPELQGQIVLEGASGLGKTMFLRYLVNNSKKITAFIPADECKNGVFKPIQERLHGLPQDEKFLRDLVWSGAISICIDGLNEVSPDTRAQVNDFARRFSRGNLIITTQPIFGWAPPATAKKFIIRPLDEELIIEFLQQQSLPDDSKLTQQAFELSCQSYLDVALDKTQNEEILNANMLALSNPMDLTVVAQLLMRNEKPDLYNLQEQQYQQMADSFANYSPDHEFPKERFAECVYKMRLDDKMAIPSDEFKNEIACMEQHKMVVPRYVAVLSDSSKAKDPEKEWYFRHDKIMEYFIASTFFDSENGRMEQHLDDSRFRGVYFLLALLLPHDQASQLREIIIQHAADTHDHTVSDQFIKIFRSRKKKAA